MRPGTLFTTHLWISPPPLSSSLANLTNAKIKILKNLQPQQGVEGGWLNLPVLLKQSFLSSFANLSSCQSFNQDKLRQLINLKLKAHCKGDTQREKRDYVGKIPKRRQYECSEQEWAHSVLEGVKT